MKGHSLQLNGQSSLQIDKPDTGDMHKHTQTIQKYGHLLMHMPQPISQEFNDLPHGFCEAMLNDILQKKKICFDTAKAHLGVW